MEKYILKRNHENENYYNDFQSKIETPLDNHDLWLQNPKGEGRSMDNHSKFGLACQFLNKIGNYYFNLKIL